MNPSTALATVLVDELVRHGVREAVLCPGSRSAPFAFALQDAERAGRLRLHVRIDERSAAFLALGLGKLTHLPVPVFTTSGTAVANLHPAVLEASHGAVPLVIISSDRPPELQGTGANQTTDQSHIFGSAVRMFHQLGAPERREGQNAVWRSVAARLCASATGAGGTEAGPVHLNVPLREPLVPDEPLSPGDARPAGHVTSEWPEGLDGREHGEGWAVVQAAPRHGVPFDDIPKTLVLLGDLPDPAMAPDVIALARVAGWPVVAEPFGALGSSLDARGLDAPRTNTTGAGPRGSQTPTSVNDSPRVPHGPLLLAADEWLSRHLPDRVLVIGRVTLTRAVAALLRNPVVSVEVVATRSRWPDPSHRASVIHPFEAVAASMTSTRQVDERWVGDWSRAGQQVAKAGAVVIEQSWPSGLAIATTVLAALPANATLFVGSSNSARDLDLSMSPAVRSTPLTVVASRGLSGIDGTVSTAIGIALAQVGRPAYALMGDLTFLHDSNGLLIGPLEPRPDLTIVVTNDDGGGIFTLLEPGEPSRATDFERVFGTPTGVSIADICRAHGVSHTLVGAAAELSTVVGQRPDGLHVVEVRVDRSRHRDLHARLRAAAATALR